MKPSERFEELTGKTGFYNIQAISNMPSIMRHGILSHERARRIEHISIALEEVQNRRERVRIPDGLMLHQYASLYFSSWNPMLSRRRSQNEEICILMVKDSVLDLEDVVVTDGNASTDYVVFYSALTGLERLDFDLIYARSWTDEDPVRYRYKKSVKCAEVLIPDVIPYTYIICAAVVSEDAAQWLRQTGFDRKILVKPEAFFKEKSNGC